MKKIIDLHMHFDGSLSVNTVNTLMYLKPERVPKEYAYLLNLTDEERVEALPKVLHAPDDCQSLQEYLTKFDLPCALLQDAESVHLAVYNLLNELVAEGIKYVEIRFAPQLHSMEYAYCEVYRFEHERRILKAMIEASKKVPGIKCGFILCCMRNLPDRYKDGYDPNYNTIRLANEFYGKGVVALDLAGAEARDETVMFRDLFAKARELKIPFTIHAGEAGGIDWRLDSLKSALDFGTKRIGHGIALEHSVELREFCKENGIGIECCPVSNLQTKAVEGGISSHPLPQFLREGILVSVNTDNRTVSNTNLEKEFELLTEVGIGESEQKQLMLNAIEMAFADEATKQWLRTFIN